MLWHGFLGLALVALLVKPLGVMFLPTTTFVAIALRWSPRFIAGLAARLAAVGLVALVVTGLAGRPGAVLALVLLGRVEPGVSRVSADILFVLGVYAQSWATTALLLGFDRRAVNHDQVDTRVWERQQRRRRQLLERWHANTDLPEAVQ